ncbi:hypothetical protein C8F01DRAFT_1255195 [Mycena amicta]|nr:hypothetical protein C8F01DRAFT_1255195 [Mycena amicta]
MHPTLFLFPLALAATSRSFSLPSSCNVSLGISANSNADTFVLLPYAPDQTWAVAGQVQGDNFVFSAVVPEDPSHLFWLAWMDSLESDTGWLTASLHDERRLSNPTRCGGPAYTQPFNFSTGSTDFVIGVPNRIWWDLGAAIGNVTFHVTTLGEQPQIDLPSTLGESEQPPSHYGTWDMRSTLWRISNITEVHGQGIGFDWYPSISPGASFVLTLGDDRGLSSGGSLWGTTTSPTFLCAYQMSGSYHVMQRLLLYFLFFFGILGLFTASNWMTGPFLGAAMAYAGATAIHAVVILVASCQASQTGTIDLDGLPIFQILSVSLYLSAPLLMGWSRLRTHTGNTSSSVIVVCIWAMLIIVGFMCSLGTSSTVIEPCAPHNTTLSDGSIRTLSPIITECAALCTRKSSILRDLGEAQMLSSSITAFHIFGLLWSAGILVGCVCATGIVVMTVNAIFRPTHGDIFTGFSALEHRPPTRDDAFIMFVTLLLLVAAPMALLLQLIIGEWQLERTKGVLPSEKPYAIGQWGQWVIVGLACAASVFSAMKHGEERERRRAGTVTMSFVSVESAR